MLDDWQADGYRWKRSSRSKLPHEKPRILKLCYDLLTSEGGLKEFTKVVYKAIGTADIMVIQYIGNEKCAIYCSHG